MYLGGEVCLEVVPLERKPQLSRFRPGRIPSELEARIREIDSVRIEMAD